MRKITVFLLIPFIIIAETLEIPEITVYGERQIRIEPVEKGLLADKVKRRIRYWLCTP